MPDPLTTPAAELPVRRLGPGDLDRCLALGADRNWGPEDRKWLFLLENSEGWAERGRRRTAARAQPASPWPRSAAAPSTHDR
ncbi:hypothetical protein GCM10010116_26930 [Microbispora rosea subsp. aerata]|nr:hypothetical protein [Microbispora rosea]GGO13390.1 hypothetical protein GCM10010116_26930 [Microbispora rosea subsp. aerata]GIH54032.1 hypothetical protein Mro02_09460 [Microbispora rosea subsp. aerata]GLJ85005.1 hypothetical protein GCM10017588_37330 [Microbispora rosea subsp. aerata]